MGTRLGRTAFTRTWQRPSSSAALRTSASSPAFDTQYADMNGWVSGPAIDDSPTNAPPPDATMAAPACFSVKKAPRRLMSITRSHSDAGSATTGPTVPVPADATQCWRPPLASVATSTARATSSSWATSHATAPHLGAVGRLGPQLGDRRVEPLLAATGERDRRAVAEQVASRRQPDAAAAAGDQPGRAGQDELAHRPSPSGR